MRGIGRRIGTLIVALGIVLGGLTPSLATSMAAPMGSHPAAMADMGMPGCPMGQMTPHKRMPCDGTGCGCCIGGTCAAPTLGAALTGRAARIADKMGSATRVLNGITFPPSLPPPILLA